MVLSIYLGVIAGILALVTYGTYLRQIVKSHSTPNPSTWGIWLFLSIINALTYFSVTKNNPWQSFIAFAVMFSTFCIFVYSFTKKFFSKISTFDAIIFLLAIILTIFWQISSNAVLSNIILQIIYLFSIFPTIAGILSGKAKEYYLAWSIGLIAYTFSTLSILVDPTSSWVSLVYPIVNGIIINLSVLIAIFYKRNK